MLNQIRIAREEFERKEFERKEFVTNLNVVQIFNFSEFIPIFSEEETPELLWLRSVISISGKTKSMSIRLSYQGYVDFLDYVKSLGSNLTREGGVCLLAHSDITKFLDKVNKKNSIRAALCRNRIAAKQMKESWLREHAKPNIEIRFDNLRPEWIGKEESPTPSLEEIIREVKGGVVINGINLKLDHYTNKTQFGFTAVFVA